MRTKTYAHIILHCYRRVTCETEIGRRRPQNAEIVLLFISDGANKKPKTV